MSLPLFYEPDLVSHLATMPLSDDSARHCIQVLRMREGDTIEITNGKGLSCLATLSISGKKQAIAHCTSFQEHSRPAAQVTLCMSLLKNPATGMVAGESNGNRHGRLSADYLQTHRDIPFP
jgi:16S rRNA (uracil1498-N3)-methyltransferase